MSPKEGKAAPAAEKKRKSKLDRINARVLRVAAEFGEIHKLLTAAGASAATELKDKITAAALRANAVAAACGELSEELLVLKKLKWEPRIGGKNVFVVGSPVAVAPRHVPAFSDFFDKDDLASLVVVEMKAKSTLVQVVKDGLKGGSFVCKNYQLQARA